MGDFEIWIEGHRATGSESTAKMLASVKAETFKDACIAFSKTAEAKGYGNFDSERLSFWGCRLFDNEKDSRKGFG